MALRWQGSSDTNQNEQDWVLLSCHKPDACTLFHDVFTEVPVQITFPLTEQCSWSLPHGNVLSFCNYNNHGEVNSEMESGIFSAFKMKDKHFYTDFNCSCSLISPTLHFPQQSGHCVGGFHSSSGLCQGYWPCLSVDLHLGHKMNNFHLCGNKFFAGLLNQ